MNTREVIDFWTSDFWYPVCTTVSTYLVMFFLSPFVIAVSAITAAYPVA